MEGATQERDKNSLYPRGFALLPSTVSAGIPENWSQMPLPGDWMWAWDPVMEVNVWQDKSGNWMVLAGICLDTHKPTADLKRITARMVRKLRVGDNRFLDYLDHLGGRFVLAYKWKQNQYFYTDAGATKAAFYTNTSHGVIVASHASLTAALEGHASAPSKAVKPWLQAKRTSYPGHFTPFAGVYHLTANVRLNLQSGKTQRFYPRKPLKQQPEEKLSTALSSIQALMDTQVRLLSTLGRPLVASLSGGVDSRFVLACTAKYSPDILYFTYHHRADYDQDLQISKQLAERLNLRHTVIKYDPKVPSADTKTPEYKEFLANMRQATYLHHGHRLAWNYYTQLPPNAIHIGGELSEILQAFWSTTAWYWEEARKPFTPAKMARAYGTPDDPDIVALFDQFARDVNFAAITQANGYDPFDFFYWEHRMGVWRSHVALESDPAFDAVSLFACRKLLELGLALPIGMRHRQELPRLGIEEYLPQAADIPIASGRPQFNKKTTE